MSNIQLTTEQKMQIIYKSLEEVASDKLLGEIDLQTSITEDLSLDSIEIMDLLLQIRDNATKNDEAPEEDVDMDRLLLYLFSGNEDITVKSLCVFIDGLLCREE